MKISVITVSYNSSSTILSTMESVFRQKRDCFDVEYIVVDGASTDGTVSLLKEFEAKIGNGDERCEMKWISEPDNGLYEAMNKGIGMATGDIVGILNADDVLAADDTLAKIAAQFAGTGSGEHNCPLRVGATHNEATKPSGASAEGTEKIDALYADIRFVRTGDSLDALRAAKTVRYCSAKCWRPWMFRFAAMVPHPSFYVRRECFERLGNYSLDYRICADFELELRFLKLAKLRSRYLNECAVVMRMGGASTSGWKSNKKINEEDLKALRTHGIWSCLPLIYLKYFFKVWGFVFKRR